MPSVGTLIVARNAAATIAGAMESALNEPIDELVLVDDVSSDATLNVARSIDDRRVKIVQLREHRSLGYARGVGVDQILSDYCFLLDADDEFMPGRVPRLLDRLVEDQLDFVADELDLFEDKSGASLRHLTIPNFLDRPPGLARLFERNYLPGIGQVAFKTERVKLLGYDSDIHGTEDSDLVLRALLSEVRFGLIREVGYRLRQSAGSVSRNRERQAIELAKALRKHDYKLVGSFLSLNGADERMKLWCLFRFALYRKEPHEAARILERLNGRSFEPDRVYEADGPFPYSEKWLLCYSGGILDLINKKWVNAVRFFETALEIESTPDVLNNLGVAFRGIGDEASAENRFLQALKVFPGYADARDNLIGKKRRITFHPLRKEASRSEY